MWRTGETVKIIAQFGFTFSIKAIVFFDEYLNELFLNDKEIFRL